MIMRLTGVGSQYIGAFMDAQGEYLDGSKTYKVTLPPHISSLGHGRTSHVLAGKGTDPARAPSEDSGTKQRTEEPWNCVLKATTHHPYSGEDQPSETDDSTRVDSERLERPHERLSS